MTLSSARKLLFPSGFRKHTADDDTTVIAQRSHALFRQNKINTHKNNLQKLSSRKPAAINYDKKIDGYSIIKMLGHGGTSTVYLATRNASSSPIALKLIFPAMLEDKHFVTRFFQEGVIIARLIHPNVVKIYQTVSSPGHHYMIMEYLSGGSLKQRIRQGLDHDQTISIIHDIASALSYVHDYGIVHRDVKSANVLFRQDNVAVLSDFGIANSLDKKTALSPIDGTVGTPSYMSPEQIANSRIDARSDLYSLGVVLYECLTGCLPYKADNGIEASLMHLHRPVPKLEDEHSVFQPLLDQLMAKNPEDRYQTAQQLLEALDEIKTNTLSVRRPLTDYRLNCNAIVH